MKPHRKYAACLTCETAWVELPGCWVCGRPADHRETVPMHVHLDMGRLIMRGRFLRGTHASEILG